MIIVMKNSMPFSGNHGMWILQRLGQCVIVEDEIVIVI